MAKKRALSPGMAVASFTTIFRRPKSLCPPLHHARGPHRAGGVAYSIKLRVRGMSGAALDEATIRILDEVNMTELASRLVHVLSGGHKRRLALAIGTCQQAGDAALRRSHQRVGPAVRDEIVALLHGLSRSEGPNGYLRDSQSQAPRLLRFRTGALQRDRRLPGPPRSFSPITFAAKIHRIFYSQLVRHDASEGAILEKTSTPLR